MWREVRTQTTSSSAWPQRRRAKPFSRVTSSPVQFPPVQKPRTSSAVRRPTTPLDDPDDPRRPPRPVRRCSRSASLPSLRPPPPRRPPPPSSRRPPRRSRSATWPRRRPRSSPLRPALSRLPSPVQFLCARARRTVLTRLRPGVLGGWPSLSDIEKKLDVSDSDLANISQSAILIPSYANYTDNGWNVRFYGLIYKQPNTNASDLVDLIDGFKADNLNDTQRSLLQNRTQALAALPVAAANVSALLYVNNTLTGNSSGIALMPADSAGELEQFVVVPNLAKNSSQVQVVGTAVANASGPGNGSVILVPSSGVSIVSDIDDVLRITQVYVPNQGLFNSFVQP
jgi:hypothetical protein